MANKSRKPSTKSRSNKKAAARPSLHDQILRDQLLYLLKGGGAHIGFDDVLHGWPVQHAGVKVADSPHTAWMLLEHMRLGQWDILEFSRDPEHVSPKWPEEFWPASEAPLNGKEWTASIAAFKRDLRTMVRLVANPKVNLYAFIAWGDGQTILREALLLADHNAYHLGQLVMLRKSLHV
jgi:hypothetical protein